MASKASVTATEDVPRNLREIVQKKFLEEVIGSSNCKLCVLSCISLHSLIVFVSLSQLESLGIR